MQYKQKQRVMTKLIEDIDGTIYKFSLNKREKTLKIYQFLDFQKRYEKHLIAVGLTKKDIRDFENDADSDLLYWMKHDYSSYFSIWR